MKCPNCGTELKEGSLYCERCGEDIHIVPDFEPELEFSMEETFQNIRREVGGDEPDKASPEELPEAEPGRPLPDGKQRRRRRLWPAALAAAVLLCAAGGAAGAYLWLDNSYNYQLKRAQACAAEEKYESAVRYYSRALELNEKDPEVKFALAETYYRKGNKMEYEYLLRDLIKDSNLTGEQLERAYGKLIAIYRARDDFDTINQLLLASDNENIISAYQSYLATPPEFSVQEGSYEQIQPLKLTSYTTGKIYYTLDGSTPDENSFLYTAPILLEEGEYVVAACFVNDFGVCSECVTRRYYVEIEKAPAPEVSAVSGQYQFPIPIEVLDDSEGVYYTMDGSTPNLNSTPYTRPIPMPLGKSTFVFARVGEDGSAGELTEREYELKMNTEFTPWQAEEAVVQYMIDSGKIFDAEGHHTMDLAGVYRYQYQYVTNISGINDFYVIAEYYRDTGGAESRTGSYFAVNAYDGEIFKLQIDESNNYTLVIINKES